MIKSKLELKFYIASDRIMNGFPAKRNLIQILKEFVSPQKDILRFLRLLRKVQYYNSKKGLLSKLISILNISTKKKIYSTKSSVPPPCHHIAGKYYLLFSYYSCIW